MHRGYTKRWRKRWDKCYHYDSILWLMMDYFIDYANYKDTEVYFPGCGLIPLSRGQHIFGYRKVSEFLNIGMSMCVRKIKLLETIGFMTIKATNKYSIATIINYDTYQSETCIDDKHSDKQSTSNRKASDKQSELPNKDKKVKKVNNPPYSPPRGIDLRNDGNGWIDVDSWDNFVEHRKSIKKPLSEKAAKISLSFLKKNIPHQKEIIETTIMNRWTGLFPLKGVGVDGKSYTSKAQNKKYEEFQRIMKL